MSVTFDDPDKLYLPEEWAEHTRTTTGKLAVERHRGVGPRYIRDNSRRVLYRAADLKAWLDECMVRPTPRPPLRD